MEQNYINHLSKENIVIGLRQVKKHINSDSLGCVKIAKDIDREIETEIVLLCQQRNIQYEFYPSKEKMGKMLGIDVACAVFGIKSQKRK